MNKTPKQDAAAAHRAAVEDLITEAMAAHEWREGARLRIETAILMAYLRGQKSMLAPPPAGFPAEEHPTPVRDVWSPQSRQEDTKPQSVRARRRAASKRP